ncbi:hypothetical protein I4I78_27905 [Pseudonocardia sp. KRD-291]|nr:hypothetical protein [Pseudonocardia sp. KRD291]
MPTGDRDTDARAQHPAAQDPPARDSPAQNPPAQHLPGRAPRDPSGNGHRPGPRPSRGGAGRPASGPDLGGRLTPNEQDLLRRLQEELAARENGASEHGPQNGSAHPDAG